MAKFYGPIGYAISKEKTPGVWQDVFTERTYRGDILQSIRKWESTEKVNDNINISNRLSVVADLFAYENLSNMRYIKWYGVYWKIASVDIERPRLIISIGDVYNGEVAHE